MHVGEQLRLRINHSKEVWTVVEPNRRIICTNGFVTSCPSSSVVAFVERQVVGDLMIFRLPNVSRSAASNQIQLLDRQHWTASFPMVGKGSAQLGRKNDSEIRHFITVHYFLKIALITVLILY